MEDPNYTDGIDKLASNLQSKIDEDEAKVFSETALYEAHHPQNFGVIENPNGKAVLTGSCGDTMEMYVAVEGDTVVEVKFSTDGCGATFACGSMLSKMAKGQKTEQVLAITDEDLIESLDGLPEENLHCARLAVATLHGAVKVT